MKRTVIQNPIPEDQMRAMIRKNDAVRATHSNIDKLVSILYLNQHNISHELLNTINAKVIEFTTEAQGNSLARVIPMFPTLENQTNV